MSKSAAAAANPECVQVVIRCRPLSSDEKKNNNKVIVRMDKRMKQVAVDNPTSGGGKSAAAADAGGPRTFTFDGVYDMSTTQVGIYEETCNPLVQSVLSGYNGVMTLYHTVIHPLFLTHPFILFSLFIFLFSDDFRLRADRNRQNFHHGWW